MIFQGIRTSTAKEPYSNDFPWGGGGGGGGEGSGHPVPPLDPGMEESGKSVQACLTLVC